MSTLTKSQESNESMGMIILMSAITISVLFYNSYHMFNWIYNMHQPQDGLNFGAALMGIGGISLAFLEIPATILLVNSIRLKDNLLLSALYILFIAFIAIMATKAGISSQTAIYDHRANQVTADNETIDQIGEKMVVAQEKRDLSISLAENYQGNLSKDTVIASARLRYAETMVALRTEKANAIRNKTSRVNINETGKNDGIDSFMILLFPAFLSIAGVISTIYLMLHVKGKLRIAAMSMENKIAQNWNSEFIANQMNELTISPMSGVIRSVKGWFNADTQPTTFPINNSQVTVKPEPSARIEQNMPVKNSPSLKAPQTKIKPTAYDDLQKGFEKIKQTMLTRGWKIEGNNATPPADITPQEMADLAAKKQALLDHYNNRPSESSEGSEKPPSEVKKLLTNQLPDPSGQTPLGKPRKTDDLRVNTTQDKAKIKGILERMKTAKSAGVGTIIECVHCGEKITKKAYTQKFCSHSRKVRKDGGNCSDEYHEVLNKYKGEG